MLDKLEKAEENYLRIEELLSKPEVISDTEHYKKLMKEYKTLTPLIDTFRKYKAAKKKI